jgi:hypothetical protein
MAEQRSDATAPQRDRSGIDVTAGAGRKDDVGHTGVYPATGPYPDGDAPVITPAEINRDSGRGARGVKVSDELKGAERMPRRGNEEDKPDSDRLSD